MTATTRLGRPVLVGGITGVDDQATPLRGLVAAHVRGLQAAARGDLDEARALLTRAADGWAAFGTASEERAARQVLRTL